MGFLCILVTLCKAPYRNLLEVEGYVAKGMYLQLCQRYYLFEEINCPVCITSRRKLAENSAKIRYLDVGYILAWHGLYIRILYGHEIGGNC